MLLNPLNALNRSNPTPEPYLLNRLNALNPLNRRRNTMSEATHR